MIGTNGNIQISTMNLSATTTESILTITSLVVDNAGTYHCVGQIIAPINSEEAMSNVITVNVTGPPAPIVSISPVDPIVDYITQDVPPVSLLQDLVIVNSEFSCYRRSKVLMGTSKFDNLDVTTTESISRVLC